MGFWGYNLGWESIPGIYLRFWGVGNIPGCLIVSCWNIPGSYRWKLTHFHSLRAHYARNILLRTRAISRGIIGSRDGFVVSLIYSGFILLAPNVHYLTSRELCQVGGHGHRPWTFPCGFIVGYDIFPFYTVGS